MDIPRIKEILGSPSSPEADKALRRLLKDISRTCPKSREQICDELSSCLGQHITPFMLNDWTSEAKKPARFPAAFVGAFCEVTQDDRLQRFLLSKRLRTLLRIGEYIEELIDHRNLERSKR